MKPSKTHYVAILVVCALLLCTPLSAQPAANVLNDLPTAIDRMVENHHLPSVVVGMGSFTYGDTQLPTPFSRWLEDELRMALTKTSHMKLFDKQVAAAMDPSILQLYKEFFGVERADAIMYGKYSIEGTSIRIRISLTDLATGGLISETHYAIPEEALPKKISVVPSTAAVQTASSLNSLISEQAKDFVLSLSTDRGKGAAYKDGEKLVLLVSSSRDAYLKIYHVDANGVAQRIWPNRFGGSGRIRAGQAMTFPGPSDGFEYILGRPYGTEYIKAIASILPFSTMEADFTDLAGEAHNAILKGFSVVSDSGSDPTRAEALVVYEILP